MLFSLFSLFECLVLEHLHPHKLVIDVHRLQNLPTPDKPIMKSQVDWFVQCRFDLQVLTYVLERYRIAESEDETHPKRSLACALISSVFCPILGEWLICSTRMNRWSISCRHSSDILCNSCCPCTWSRILCRSNNVLQESYSMVIDNIYSWSCTWFNSCICFLCQNCAFCLKTNHSHCFFFNLIDFLFLSLVPLCLWSTSFDQFLFIIDDWLLILIIHT